MRDSVLEREVFLLGFSPRHKGFYYLCSVLSELMGRNGYVSAAEAYGIACRKNRDDPSRVERCIRYAIYYAWEVNRGGIRELFPGSQTPPTPVELIRSMLWKLDEIRE
ncbi:MAG: sporulation initiation factor Spo0A C-terminal domain-containing protein [Clostridiales bacterium]|nr:sporulation initiation factor Spo0A C-terminal domain-containing protein [Clostridiales bacterium]